jgi:hypothetical protein
MERHRAILAKSRLNLDKPIIRGNEDKMTTAGIYRIGRSTAAEVE